MKGTSIQDVIVGFCDGQEYKAKYPVPNQFVESLYNKLLGRHSDPGGFQYWINLLTSGGKSTVDVIHGFTLSREYALQRATECYNKFLGRQPDQGGLDGWANLIQHGLSLQNIIKGFVSSEEYQQRALSRQ